MYRLSRYLGSFSAPLSALIFLAHCGGSDLTLPKDTTPAEIAKIDGDNQSGSAGSPLTDPLVVKVVDQLGEPLPDQRVAFTIASDAPGAEVRPNETTTDSAGVAQAEWVVGTTSGTQAVVARVLGADELQVTFEASVGSAEPRRTQAVSGDNQTGAVGTALTDPLVVLVTDEFGNPVSGARVQWNAENGRVDPRSGITGPDGLAQATWVLGPSTGAQTARASSEGLEGSPVTFTSTAVAGSASRLVRVSGNNQTSRPGQQLDAPLVVRLVDRSGNGIPNQAVSWVVGVGGGSVPSTTSTTDENGETQTRWTLGPTTGLNTLHAVVSGVGVVTFRATGTRGGGGGGGSTASRLAFRVQPPDVMHRHEIISPPVEVVVLDQAGHRVTEGQFTIRLDLIDVKTDKAGGHDERRTQSGIAVFPDLRINPEGEFLLRASTKGLSPVNSERFEVND